MIGAPPRGRSTGRLAAAVAVSLVLLVSACESDQDPGLETPVEGPGQTSDTLGTCPPDGPDESTPAAGCIGPDGAVLRP